MAERLANSGSAQVEQNQRTLQLDVAEKVKDMDDVQGRASIVLKSPHAGEVKSGRVAPAILEPTAADNTQH